ncbi:MAG: tyrosine-protein phosphatase [Gemmatales bacterium]|nr:tyrosine-protein phosphatase [Gemmatales bacterium]MDW8385699.1 tyrosine-protein phosphatase [Gemmatales bacterium]
MARNEAAGQADASATKGDGANAPSKRAEHSPCPRVHRPWLYDGVRLAILALVCLFAAETLRVLFGDNLHPVVSEAVYRSAQLDEGDLERVVQQHNIRSVLNLRGSCPGFAWYENETRILKRLGVQQYDVALSSGMVPGTEQLRELLDILDTAQRPLLIHCRRGSDRTGLVAAMCLLVEADHTLADAHGQLSLRYGHIPWGATGRLRWVLDWYEEWLVENGLEHSPDVFRTWVCEYYRPGPYWAEIEPLEVPRRLPQGRPVAARFRVHNRSRFPWRFRQAAGYGFHLRYLLRTPDRKSAFTGGAGFFEETLNPGQSLDLTLSLPAVHKPGKYELLVDMAEENVTWFFLLGSPPFHTEVTVERE